MDKLKKQGSRIAELIDKGREQGYLTYADVNDHLPEDISDPDQVDEIIGLGGNIKAFLNAYKVKKMKSENFLKKYKELKNLEINKKIQQFGFASDRADVIDHALEIYVRIIKKLDIKTIQSTKWGVSDSIAVKTFHELYSKKMSIYEDK